MLFPDGKLNCGSTTQPVTFCHFFIHQIFIWDCMYTIIYSLTTAAKYATTLKADMFSCKLVYK